MSIRLATVKSEIHNVLSTVRLTERSAVGSSRFESEVLLRDETPVVRRLKSLHDYLQGFDDLEQVDAPTFLEPFLEVIRTPTSNGVVTGIALSSLNKLLLYGSLSAESPRGAEAVNLAVEAVCNCRFEASHHYGDEVVLLQILEVLVSLLRCPVGNRLTEENAWSLVQVCYHMAVDPALSELLRASAANHLSHVVLTVFSRAGELTDTAPMEDEDERSNAETEELSQDYVGEDGEMASVKQTNNNMPYTSRLLTRILSFLAKLTDPATSSSTVLRIQEPSATTQSETLRAMGLQLINIALETAGEVMGSHRECVRIIQNDLCKFLLSNSQTDDLPVLALTLRVVYNLFSAMKGHLKVQLEVFLTSVHFRIVELSSASNEKKELALESLLDFCHDPALVLDLHANYDCDVNCSNLFEGLCRLLCKRALPESATSGLTALNVLALEGVYSVVAQLSSRCIPLDENAPDAVEADGNERGVGVANAGEDDSSFPSSTKLMRDDELIRRKTHKRRLLLAASQFNKAPNKPYWREYAWELGILTFAPPGSVTASLPSSPHQQHHHHFSLPDSAQDQSHDTMTPTKGKERATSPKASSSSTVVAHTPSESTALTVVTNPVLDEQQAIELANFVLTTPGLDKAAIGEFLSDAENRPILRKYVEQFEMKDLRIDLALRRVLECFRIPGEAQKIERVMEGFSQVYFAQNPNSTFASVDAVLIFAFSIIMLHTDRHSRSIPENKRMTEEQFVRNVRGINDGKDFDPQVLSQVFRSVSEREFILSYDATGESIREWDVVLRHSSKVEFARFSKRGHFKRAGPHERDMFEILFDPTLRAIDSALETTLDGRVVIRTMKCAADLAKIASYFDCTEEFNQILILLCRHFFLLVRDGLSLAIQDHVEEIETLYRTEVECASLDDMAAAGSDVPAVDADGKMIAFHEKQKRVSNLLGAVEATASNPESPVRALLIARSIMHLCQAHGNCAREAWANAVRVIALLKSERLLPTISKDDLALSTEDQRLLFEEKSLFESRKSRLPISTAIQQSISSPTSSSAMPMIGGTQLDTTTTTLVVPPNTPGTPKVVPVSPSKEKRLQQQQTEVAIMNTVSTESSLLDEDDEVDDEDVSSVEIDKKSSSVWNTVTSFLFGAIAPSNSQDQQQQEMNFRISKEYRRSIKAAQNYFRISDVFLGLVHSTWNLNETSLAHLLTALSSPFSPTPPSWCTTPEFTAEVAASCLDLVVLIFSANTSRVEQIAPFLDTSFAYALAEMSDEVPLIQSAIKSLFQVCSLLLLRQLNVFEMMPQSFDALSTLLASSSSSENTAGGGTELVTLGYVREICYGLGDMSSIIDTKDLQGWKTWFRILTKCVKSSIQSSVEASPSSSPVEHVLNTMSKLLDDQFIYRSNIVMIADLLQAIVSLKVPQDEKRRAVALFKRVHPLTSLSTINGAKRKELGVLDSPQRRKSTQDVQQQVQDAVVAPSLHDTINADEDTAVWVMFLAMLQTWWDDPEVEAEVSDSLASLLFEGLVNPKVAVIGSGYDFDAVITKRVHVAFDRVLFPLVTKAQHRRTDAVSLMSRFFLACASLERIGNGLVDHLLPHVIDSISADFEDPNAADDSKESAVQRILNIVNVVIVGTEFEAQRLASVSKELDIILPSGWREMVGVKASNFAPPSASELVADE